MSFWTTTNCAAKVKGKKTPVDGGEGVVVKKEKDEDSDKENKGGNLATER